MLRSIVSGKRFCTLLICYTSSSTIARAVYKHGTGRRYSPLCINNICILCSVHSTPTFSLSLFPSYLSIAASLFFLFFLVDFRLQPLMQHKKAKLVYTCRHLQIYTCGQTNTNTCAHAYTYTQAHTHTPTHTCVHANTHA